MMGWEVERLGKWEERLVGDLDRQHQSCSILRLDDGSGGGGSSNIWSLGDGSSDS